MREFIDSMGVKYDLDNPETYDYLPKNRKELDKRMFEHIGFAHCYMYYMHKDLFCPIPENLQKSGLSQVCVDQKLRVEKLIQYFCENRIENFNNPIWFQEQIFIFENEIDNMC